MDRFTKYLIVANAVLAGHGYTLAGYSYLANGKFLFIDWILIFGGIYLIYSCLRLLSFYSNPDE
jgi:hypothetical protein